MNRFRFFVTLIATIILISSVSPVFVLGVQDPQLTILNTHVEENATIEIEDPLVPEAIFTPEAMPFAPEYTLSLALMIVVGGATLLCFGALLLIKLRRND